MVPEGEAKLRCDRPGSLLRYCVCDAGVKRFCAWRYPGCKCGASSVTIGPGVWPGGGSTYGCGLGDSFCVTVVIF